LSKNTLKGFVDLEFTDVGVVVKECPWHEKNDREWVSFPGRSYSDKTTGETKWANMIDFTNADVRVDFQASAIKAIYAFIQPPDKNEPDTLF
jgi:hypothetical protein